jgi:hypothetical protein
MPKRADQFRDPLALELDDLGQAAPLPLPPAPNLSDPIDDLAPPGGRIRRWERQNPPVKFRGVLAELDSAVLRIAELEDITKDNSAEILLSYAFHLYQKGKLPVTLIPGRRKMRVQEVAGEPDEPVRKRRKQWQIALNPTPPRSDKRKEKITKRPPTADRSALIVSYRISSDLESDLRTLTDVAVACDVVNYFLETSVRAYFRGELVIISSGESSR